MNRQPRAVGLAGVLAVIGGLGLMTACRSLSPVSPLPIETPSAAITIGSAPSSAPAASPTPRAPSTSVTGTPACRGAVAFTVDASEDGPPWPAYCVATGSLLRLENHGPEGVSVKPAENVSCVYEAGVRECRFLQSGTVRFTIRRETDTRVLTVVVVG